MLDRETSEQWMLAQAGEVYAYVYILDIALSVNCSTEANSDGHETWQTSPWRMALTVGNRGTVRSRADSRTRDHMACAQARTIRVRAAALP
jgi:hypothetical protein